MAELHTKSRSLLIIVSKFISDFFNPLTSLFLYFAYFSYRNYGVRESMREFLPILLIIIIPISGWIIWNVRKGRYSNMDVSNRNQRKSLYVVITVVMLAYLIINYMLDGQVDFTMLFLFVLIVLMQISNFFIKSSMHTSLNVFTAALFFALNPTVGIIWIGIAVTVGITRVILKRHTIPEVLMGAFLATAVSFAYLYTNIQLQ